MAGLLLSLGFELRLSRTRHPGRPGQEGVSDPECRGGICRELGMEALNVLTSLGDFETFKAAMLVREIWAPSGRRPPGLRPEFRGSWRPDGLTVLGLPLPAPAADGADPPPSATPGARGAWLRTVSGRGRGVATTRERVAGGGEEWLRPVNVWREGGRSGCFFLD